MAYADSAATDTWLTVLDPHINAWEPLACLSFKDVWQTEQENQKETMKSAHASAS